jgi:hypothetical protein
VILVSPDMMLTLHLHRHMTPEQRSVLAPGGERRAAACRGEGAAPGRWRALVGR